ncbi:hypothetical protein [Rhizobium leguminosarum]
MRKTYVPTPAADPVYLYTDDIVGIVPERHINNGQPSLHAFLLSQAALRAGELIVHVGAGAGYYSAIAIVNGHKQSRIEELLPWRYPVFYSHSHQ